MEIQIADRLFINPANFKTYNQDIVHYLLREISNSINFLTGYHGETNCIICKSPFDHPLCSKASENFNIIFLSTKGDYWCQWVYQFAHEYLHHVINGSFSGEIDGVIWFEESLCELSSIWHIAVMHEICIKGQDPILRGFAPLAQDYLTHLVLSNPDLKSQIQSSEDISQWLPLLSERCYHRDHYNAIACRMLDLFQKNPCLWRMTTQIGDSHSYQSLIPLWNHLRKVADDSWRGSLEKLIQILS